MSTSPRDSWPAASFAGRLTPAQLEYLLSSGEPLTYPPGAVLMRDGDWGEFLLLILGGEVKVVAARGTPQERLLDVRGRGALLGDISYLTGIAQTTTVIALRYRAVSAMRLDRTRFTDILAQHPRVALAIARVVAEQLCAERKRLDVTTSAVAGRVLHALVEMSSTFGSEIPLTQLEISQLVNLSQVSVQRALRNLAARSLVKPGYGKVSVPCLECLRHALQAAPGADKLRASRCPTHHAYAPLSNGKP